MDDKLYPLIVLLVGIVVVFVGLVSLVFIVKLMALICSGFAKKEKKANVANPASDIPEKNAPANPGMSDEERRRLITAISAAIGEMTGLDNIRIKSIKRIRDLGNEIGFLQNHLYQEGIILFVCSDRSFNFENFNFQEVSYA